jgi:ribulose-5-phosphate 4-epimerase/fuculose-1-phosphate aldolase
MKQLIKKYVQKLYQSGLVNSGNALIGALDDECVWNQKHERVSDLSMILTSLPINALIFATPKAPYNEIIHRLTQTHQTAIYPQDTETRTFLHEIPIVRTWNQSEIISALSRRKAVIIPGEGIIATGTLTPEQAFVVFSSICFACFVCFFVQIYNHACQGQSDLIKADELLTLMDCLQQCPDQLPELKKGPFDSEDNVYEAIIEAGYYTVVYGLVDSYFGNISYRFNDALYISQTASSLDELSGCIDPCPLDGSSCTAITASSEFSAHKQIVSNRHIQAILHGHPKFSVIMSMICSHRSECKNNGRCHTHCSRNRSMSEIPIICGEVGCGPYGLVHTLPAALKTNKAAIVYGHGVFTSGEIDFRSAFKRLAETERTSQKMYLKTILSMI